MQVIVKEDDLLSEDSRLIRRLYKVDKDENFHEGFKFAVQYLFLRDETWLELVRIDNYRHDRKKSGVHIHKFGSKKVMFESVRFEEARHRIIELAQRVKTEVLLGLR